MYECFHCGEKAVGWSGDFDFSDFEYEGEGIVHICHCSKCGAEIEYRVPIGKEEEDGTEETGGLPEGSHPKDRQGSCPQENEEDGNGSVL